MAEILATLGEYKTTLGYTAKKRIMASRQALALMNHRKIDQHQLTARIKQIMQESGFVQAYISKLYSDLVISFYKPEEADG